MVNDLYTQMFRNRVCIEWVCRQIGKIPPFPCHPIPKYQEKLTKAKSVNRNLCSSGSYL